MEPSTAPSEGPRLDTLSADVLLTVISYLETAQSLAHLGRSCRRLHQVVHIDGWRTFVRSCFPSLTLPLPLPPSSPAGADHGWRELAQSLTSQAREWERRAFVIDAYARPEGKAWAQQLQQQQHGGRGGRGGGPPARGSRPRLQTVPCHIVLDVHVQPDGQTEWESLVWGAGEDVVCRSRKKIGGVTKTEVWMSAEGAKQGFLAGRDDVTALKVLDCGEPASDAKLQRSRGAVVGRAGGDLRLIDTSRNRFGKSILKFRPVEEGEENSVSQREIQTLDTDTRQQTLAAATKDDILLYSLYPDIPEPAESEPATKGPKKSPHVRPHEVFSLKEQPDSKSFKFVRTLKYMKDDSLVAGLTGSAEPLRYLTIRPTGIEASTASSIERLGGADYGTGSGLFGVRAVQPIDGGSLLGGGGQLVLSSWEDGTVRLQDLRTPSAHDRVYQDNFDPTTPLDSLLTYGLERFIAGSGRSPVLKIFDFRWPGRATYHYTAALPCDVEHPFPHPRPPTGARPPTYAATECCDYGAGRRCRWHALSRSDFYRPNYNIYLPYDIDAISPVYTLAKASDASATVYAGLSGAWAELNLKSGQGITAATASELPRDGTTTGTGGSGGGSSARAQRRYADIAYLPRRGRANVIETGDGFELLDLTHTNRIPGIRKQVVKDYGNAAAADGGCVLPDALQTKRNRLDEWLQTQDDFSLVFRHVY